MSVRVLCVTGMPFNTKVWVDDRDDGRFIVYMDQELISEPGARALEQILNTTVVGWKRLDTSKLYTALRAITG